MPKQRSKKNDASRKAVVKAPTEFEDLPEQIDSENDGLGIMEKDEEEDELERLVMGDDAGFRANLGMGDVEMDEVEEGEGNGIEEDDAESVSGIENVDDADVRNMLMFDSNWS